MKTLNRFIIEKLKLGKDTKIYNYNFYPKNFDELKSLIKQLLKERGKDADLNDIDVSQVTTFDDPNKRLGLFYELDPYNIDISKCIVFGFIFLKYCFIAYFFSGFFSK